MQSPLQTMKHVLFISVSFALVACGGPRTINPADIKGTYAINNAPVPVPYPKWKPKRGNQRAIAQSTSSRSSTASGGTVTVKRGNTVYGIARANGVSVRDVINANRLKPPYALAVGQRLTIPGNRFHTVKRGETGYSISRQYGVTVSSLMKTNGIRAPYSLAVGQKLRLPGGATQVASAPASSSQPSARQSKGRTTIPTPPARTGSGFSWPVTGQLASRFGPKAGGLHNDGINILAKQGAPVRAAEAGVVAYASNALEGYGNLLLVKHAGGWVTAYAHNERLLVRTGQKVNKGEVIARVGATGGVNKPQLHFEIRKGRRALDPLRYLSRQNAKLGVTSSAAH